MRTVFLGGIHGAGKTQVAGRLSQELGLQCYSAGQLLRSRPSRVAEVRQAPQNFSSFDADQLFVVERLHELVKPLEPVILDGHFAILRDGAEVTAVPTKYFMLLEPLVLLLLDTPVHEAHRRLTLRDGIAPAPETLEKLRDFELATARSVSHSLSIPLCVLARSTESYSEALACLRHHQLGTGPTP